jgi:hypothetical protein
MALLPIQQATGNESLDRLHRVGLGQWRHHGSAQRYASGSDHGDAGASSAVFMPHDTTDYETMTIRATLEIFKAVPQIK